METHEEPGLREQLLQQRYLRKDEEGRVIETVDQMFWRVAYAIATSEARYGASEADVGHVAALFHGMMKRVVFLLNSPALMNAGRLGGMLAACFVLGLFDSIEGIFETVRRTALVQRSGGGTGFALDALRPTGDLVRSSGGRTSGPISFWRVLDQVTEAIQQGSHRRGANMAMMSLEHPDILKFITAKQDLRAFTNFNISAKVSDEFMEALQSEPNRPHEVTNPRTGERYRLPRSLNIRDYQLQDLVPADQDGQAFYTVQDVWDMVIENAHATGEPGVCLIDRVNRDNPTPALGPITATNPCGEQPLLPEEACVLGSLQVARFVGDNRTVDWKRLGRTVQTAVRFLDNTIDANCYPVPEIEKVTLGNRKIGLGLMGLADVLVLLGIRYDSEEAVQFAGKLCEFIQRQAHAASQALAEQRGCFPNWVGSIWDTIHHVPMRNAACTTIAPTGSLSILARASAGIEPIFRLAYRRRALDGQEFSEVHSLVETLGERDGWLDQRVRDAMLEGVPAREIPGIPKALADVLVTAHEVAPEWHVRMQAAVQEYVDNAVSKTVNLPADATVADVDKVFRLAHRLGCKGITVYRDGARQGQTLSAGSEKPKAAGHPRSRVRVTDGKTFKFRMGCGTLFVTVNRDEQGLCEVFANLGKAGGCPSQSEATCRAVSVALRSGIDPTVLVEQLKGIRCLSTCVARKQDDGVDVLSCPDAIARAIQEAVGDDSDQPVKGNPCPDCGRPLRKESGCLVCGHCGYSKCG